MKISLELDLDNVPLDERDKAIAAFQEAVPRMLERAVLGGYRGPQPGEVLDAAGLKYEPPRRQYVGVRHRHIEAPQDFVPVYKRRIPALHTPHNTIAFVEIVGSWDEIGR